MNLADILAEHAVSIQYKDLPPEVIRCAKERILDTMGAMIVGWIGWPERDAYLHAVLNHIPQNSFHLIEEDSDQEDLARAAMVYAAYAHAMELDDGHKNAGVHVGCSVVPTALVWSKALNKSGKDCIEAIVTGYEIACRIAVAGNPSLIQSGNHPSSICAGFAAMVTTGKLLGLNSTQMANGLRFAAHFACGLMECTVSGQATKCMIVGQAVQNGVMAALYAQQGLESSEQAFEGESGFFKARAAEVNAEMFAEYLDDGKYLILDSYSKFYPTVRHSQPAIEAVLELAAENNLHPDDIAKVNVKTHRVAYRLTGQIYRPQSSSDAKFSLPYCVAVALYEGNVGIPHLQKESFTTEKYLDFAQKVTVSVENRIDELYPKKRGALVEIILADGRCFEKEVYSLKGSPDKPSGWEDLENKFRTNVAPCLDAPVLEKLISNITQIENLIRIDEILAV